MRLMFVSVALAATVATPALAEGFRVEAHGGFDRVEFAGSGDEGIVYGVGVGYDLPVSKNMFIGIEGNVEDSSTKECANDVLALGDRACVSAGRDLSAVVRAGWNLGPTSKAYVLAGYTNARIKVSYDDGTGAVSDGANGDGVRVGAGMQFGFGGGLFGKAEYRYSNYESDFSRHQVVAGIGFEF